MSTPVTTSMSPRDPFWAEDLRILVRSDRWTEFYPSSTYTFNENLNAITRFFLYLTIILLLLQYTYKVLYLFIFILVSTYFLKQNYQQKEDFLTQEYKSQCQTPTKENPFMNILVPEMNTATRKKACPLEEAQTKVEEHFNTNLFRDIDDIWERNNSQRQFYTMPNTENPNNQELFAKWLYGTHGKTLKERDNHGLSDGSCSTGSDTERRVENAP